MSTVCPRCRSGAVGSNPALTRSGLPRASFFRRSSSVRSSAAPRLGIVFFGFVVVLTMLAAMSFDPRLIWDAEVNDDGQA